MGTFFPSRREESIARWREGARSETARSARVPAGTDLYKVVGGWRRRHGHRLLRLRVAPVVEHSDLLYAGNGAARAAELVGQVFMSAHFRCVLLQRNSRIAALLRAPMHEAVLADIQVARTRTAAPSVFPCARNVVLKIVEA